MAIFSFNISKELNNQFTVEQDGGTLILGNAEANRVMIKVTQDGEHVALEGSIVAQMLRADGQTLTWDGAIISGTAVVVLPASAYSVQGPAKLNIDLLSNDQRMTLAVLRLMVDATTSNASVAPVDTVPDLESLLAKIQDMETATAAAVSASTFYPMVYTGQAVFPARKKEYYAIGNWVAGEVIPDKASGQNYHYVLEIGSLIEGETFTIKAHNGMTARPWGIIDKDRVAMIWSEDDDAANDLVTVPEGGTGGTLIVQVGNSSISNAKVTRHMNLMSFEGRIEHFDDSLDQIAVQFDSGTAYVAGQMVYYNDMLYRFTANHPAGAWTGADASRVILSDEVGGIKSEVEDVKDDIDDVEGQIGDITNVVGLEMLSGDYSGTRTIDLNLTLDSGKYIIEVDNITSTDTDRSVSGIAFQYPTGYGSDTILLNRGGYDRHEIQLTHNVVGVYIYASDNYSHSAGDTFTFTGLRVSKSYPLLEEIDLLHGEEVSLQGGTLSTTLSGLDIEIVPGIVKLNGTTNNSMYIKLTGKPSAVNSGTDMEKNESCLVLMPGHRYRAVMKLVSGSATVSSNSWLTAFKPGSSSTDANHVVRSRNGSEEFYLDITADSTYNTTNFILYLRSTEAFTNAVYTISLYDLTAIENGIRRSTTIGNAKYTPALPFQGVEQMGMNALGLTLKFTPGVVSINGTTNNQAYIKLSGDFGVVQDGNVVKTWKSYLSLIPGRKYKAIMNLVSGSATISNDSRFTAYKRGANATDSSHVSLTRTGSTEFVAEITADSSFTDVNLVVYLVSGETFTNAVYAISVYDVTDALPFLYNQNGGLKVVNGVDSSAEIWSQWDGRLAFGMTTSLAPLPVIIDGQLYANGTIISHNTESTRRNRWGLHVFEAYSSDNYSRMTMLLDKHMQELGVKPSFEMYYYTGANHYAPSYAYTKIGSDVRDHSFFFDRDRMIAVGDIDCRFPITLARIDPSELDDTYSTVAAADSAYEPENYPDENISCLKYISLKNAEDGAMFYDAARKKVVCKIDGKWCDLAFTDASSNYDF